MNKSPPVCIDFDGVLSFYDEWKGGMHLGEPNPEGVKLAHMFHNVGIKVLVFTCRMNHAWEEEYDYDEVERCINQWLEDHNLSFCELYTGTGKPFAFAYIDDRGVQFKANIGPAIDVFIEAMKLSEVDVL